MPENAPTPATPPADILTEVRDLLRDLRAQANRPAPQTFGQNDAIAYVGLPESTWFRLRSAGEIPEPVEVPGSGPRWRKRDLDKYLDSLKPRRKKRTVRTEVVG
jgi:predicted DNA-binding transcriptional regulator AlpA